MRTPDDCHTKISRKAVHWLDKSKPLGGEIACLHPVEGRKQYTDEPSAVTCWDFVQILLERGRQVREHKPRETKSW